MKKLAKPFLLACLLSSIIAFTSCNDGEEGDDFVAAELVGSWSFSSFDFSATFNGEDFIEYLKGLGLDDDYAEETLDDFSEDFDEFEGVTFSFESGGVFTVTESGDSESGSWSLNEDTQMLTLTFGTESLTFEVMSLTSSSMSITLSETLSGFDFDDDGADDELIFFITYGFSK